MKRKLECINQKVKKLEFLKEKQGNEMVIIEQRKSDIKMIGTSTPRQINATSVNIGNSSCTLADQEFTKLERNPLISYTTPAVKMKSRRFVPLREINSPEILDFDISSVDSDTEEPETTETVSFSTPNFSRSKRITTPPPPKERRPMS